MKAILLSSKKTNLNATTSLLEAEIGKPLAQHYGFTQEELDFIVNYDIKYRMGLSTVNGENGEEES